MAHCEGCEPTEMEPALGHGIESKKMYQIIFNLTKELLLIHH